VSRFFVRPALCGDPGKVWLQSESGEGGDFSKAGFVDALCLGMKEGRVDEALDRFFWENF
jgi:hypothetical protein